MTFSGKSPEERKKRKYENGAILHCRSEERSPKSAIRRQSNILMCVVHHAQA